VHRPVPAALCRKRGMALARSRRRALICAYAGLIFGLAALGFARDAGAEPQAGADAQAWVAALWPAAQARGVSRPVFDRALGAFAPDPEVAEFAARQPEQEMSTGAYLEHLVTEERIATGRQLAIQHRALLDAIEAAYGVDRRVLLAIWGIESAYGTAKGTRNVVRSLATLAMVDPRRSGFWTRELLAALRLLQDNSANPMALVGSWAGAMGHTQFIPSTYSAHAVDFDKDGRRDVWDTVADALASTANYLKSSGWTAGAPWGFEVTLPSDFDYAWSAPGRTKTLAEWLASGVQPADGRRTPIVKQPLQLVLPAGVRGPAFLVTRNLRALLKYNQSLAYALAVGHLADRIAGGGAPLAAWPAEDRSLTRPEREELQRLLISWGFSAGEPDGIIGDQTRTAIRATQHALSLAEDGHPTIELLRRLRDGGVP
jgi:membrane-bound lytic murein transglycosylase B